MKDSNKDTGKIILAALAGAAAGAIAGILMAPASGRSTRDGINKNVSNLKSTIGESVREFADMGKEKLNELRGEANGAFSNGEAVMDSTSSNSNSNKKSNSSNSRSNSNS